MGNGLSLPRGAIVPAVMTSAAFTMLGPLVITVVPYHLRGVGSALSSIYIFLVGPVGGDLLSALFLDALGPRLTVLLIAFPSSLAGDLLLYRGSSFIRYDLPMIVGEIREELAEHERQQEHPDRIPAIQVNDIDFSYGNVQVLFGVRFEVRKGEVLALLGTKRSKRAESA